MDREEEEEGEERSRLPTSDGRQLVLHEWLLALRAEEVLNPFTNLPAPTSQTVGVRKEGQTFTIEPMVNAGTWKDVTWPDGWTSATADGSRSAQFEPPLLVTATVRLFSLL